MKAGFISLGCAKNLVDTELMLGILNENGIELVTNPADADILIVNTCAFIQAAKEESITTILNMAEYKESGRCRALIVAGCLGQRYGQELLDEIPEADAIIGTSAWDRIMEAVRDSLRGHRVVITDHEKIYDSKTPRIRTTPEYSAWVKIAEGCDHRCSFCAIPLIRGKFISRSSEDIVAEVQNLVADGVKEINLIAQDSTNYGRDLYGEPSLARLLKELVKIPEQFWIRVLYSYPKNFTDELIEVIASESKICKYVDLPLQHASNSVLERMKRPDTREEIETLLTKIREKIPGVAIRSTFIVGFPGESEEDFQTLKTFIQTQRFDHVGIFAYSQEEGTIAATLPDQVSEEVMQNRYHELMSLQSQISQEINESLVEKEFKVLIEGRDEESNNIAIGRSYREAPEVDGQIYVEGDRRSQPGDMVRVRIKAGFTYDLAAERVLDVVVKGSGGKSKKKSFSPKDILNRLGI